MAKKPKNSGKPWTPADVKQLTKLAKENTPTRVAALKLQRTPAAVAQKASQESISLKPVNPVALWDEGEKKVNYVRRRKRLRRRKASMTLITATNIAWESQANDVLSTSKTTLSAPSVVASRRQQHKNIVRHSPCFRIDSGPKGSSFLHALRATAEAQKAISSLG